MMVIVMVSHGVHTLIDSGFAASFSKDLPKRVNSDGAEIRSSLCWGCSVSAMRHAAMHTEYIGRL